MQDDPYLFTAISASAPRMASCGWRLCVQDPFDLLQILRLARRIAGKRRVINEIEVMTGSVDHD